MCGNRDVDVKVCVVFSRIKNIFPDVKCCKHSSMGLTARALFDINGHGKICYSILGRFEPQFLGPVLL